MIWISRSHDLIRKLRMVKVIWVGEIGKVMRIALVLISIMIVHIQ